MVGYFAYDLVRRLGRLPNSPWMTCGCRTWVMLLATDIAAVDHHEGHHHPDRQRGELERHRRTWTRPTTMRSGAWTP